MSWKLEILSTEVLYYEMFRRILDILRAEVKQKRPWEKISQKSFDFSLVT